ncbi:hypothetical protein [Phaeobacter sp. 11ANDIMAR09]|uniref:hypothetical protein n=1 Tax=Phaeobacter sp. 11ANDIMAR09 TaxID=1225647 RepID=UPI0006C8B34F|nr:hypothetical protein [Phaeobacter sp. 11ANDIMAR09]KPD12608.1 hypothetical protein AN476_10400 [Phaeobacter sp. 11ANDIMAR09]OIQ34490.1 MAG: hypothetical protein BM559_05655 [Roseobacter sp. MedPE-SWchi]
MRTFQGGPEETAQRLGLGEHDKEKASLEALIDYAIQCAMETNVFSGDEKLEDVRRNLCRAVL